MSSRSKRPRRLRRGSAAARLLGLWVRIPRGAWMFVCCECYVMSSSGLCGELISRPEESCRRLCVVCALETSRMKRLWPSGGVAPKTIKQTSSWVSQMTTDIFRLRGPSFDELLNTVTTAIAKTNNNMWEAVTLSPHLFFTLRYLTDGRTVEDLNFFERCTAW
jgi:hypothetical protein